MGLLISKVLTYVAMPLGTAILLAALALTSLLVRRWLQAALLLLLGLAWVGLWATPVFSDWVRCELESRYPPVPIEALPSADVIVVLGGGIGAAFSPRLHPDLSAGADRVWHAARLYHAGKAPWVLVSGGMLPWHRGPAEADAMQGFLTALGVPASAILLEDNSATTHENAVETARVMAEAGLRDALLVTSALHMQRAEASFRAVGIAVTPAATDYEVVDDGPLTPLDLLPEAGALEASSRALKEWLGLWVYRQRGWAL
jgi:uncharacterized SAM-binding protein YcdF (DUF218 family)